MDTLVLTFLDKYSWARCKVIDHRLLQSNWQLLSDKNEGYFIASWNIYSNDLYIEDPTVPIFSGLLFIYLYLSWMIGFDGVLIGYTLKTGERL